jgi:hypothetical protein
MLREENKMIGKSQNEKFESELTPRERETLRRKRVEEIRKAREKAFKQRYREPEGIVVYKIVRGLDEILFYAARRSAYESLRVDECKGRTFEELLESVDSVEYEVGVFKAREGMTVKTLARDSYIVGSAILTRKALDPDEMGELVKAVYSRLRSKKEKAIEAEKLVGKQEIEREIESLMPKAFEENERRNAILARRAELRIGIEARKTQEKEIVVEEYLDPCFDACPDLKLKSDEWATKQVATIYR